MTPFQRWGTVSYSPFIVTMALSCIISQIENRDFFITPEFDAPPPVGGRRRNIVIPFATEELEWCG